MSVKTKPNFVTLMPCAQILRARTFADVRVDISVTEKPVKVRIESPKDPQSSTLLWFFSFLFFLFLQLPLLLNFYEEIKNTLGSSKKICALEDL